MSTRLIIGDCREVLRTLADESVHCIVTSPPYFGLRDYGTAGQIGLEATPEAFIAEMVAVFREMRRVLRSDGTCWLNLGDSYAGSMKGSFKSDDAANEFRARSDKNGNTLGQRARTAYSRSSLNPPGYKPKDLLMMPARVVLALQADGWWLRSDIIWAKPNPMPESVTDRPTNAHEHVFLLTKSARYFYDAEAVKESGAELERQRQDRIGGANGHTVRHSAGGMIGASPTRNLRNVWTIATAPYSGAHFATFPPAMVEPCIKAGTSENGCCPACGAPWVRKTKVSYNNPGNRTTNGPRSLEQRHETAGFAVRLEKEVATLGWAPTCTCPPAEPIPATVLDPFSGAGTVGMVADRLGRDSILIELNPEYAALSNHRIIDDAGLFAEVNS